jgi:spore maturation protein CgeB
MRRQRSKLLIVGYAEPGQLGSYLFKAAQGMHLDCDLADMREAETSNRVMQKLFWQFRGKRPAHLRSFAKHVDDLCVANPPDVLLTTGGRVPLERSHLERLRGYGITVANYSSDDPWNPGLYAPWFIEALASYDIVFTPRRANLNEFRRAGVRELHYLPFAYDPEEHRPECGASARNADVSDVLFVGGSDADRLAVVLPLVRAGLKLALFGQYWDRHEETRPFSRGVAGQDRIRSASSSAKIVLCLVRRANRDEHVMRSYEAAAIGGCILAEDTQDHRRIFGPEGQSAVYFDSVEEMVRHATRLSADGALRRNLALALRERMRAANDTYADRLREILARANAISQPGSGGSTGFGETIVC